VKVVGCDTAGAQTFLPDPRVETEASVAPGVGQPRKSQAWVLECRSYSSTVIDGAVWFFFGGEREREKENLKQASCPAGSLTQDSVSQP